MAFLDETGLQRVRDKINGLYKRRDELIGSIIWWTGTTDNIPANARICNGQAISRTTYSKLFSIIGTSYGSGDGSTTFALPDLRVSYDNYGRFIRARFSNTVNNKQDDAIRNTTGTLSAYGDKSNTSGIFAWVRQSFGFNTSASGSADMHQNEYSVSIGSGNETHPYNISMIPIIIVS